MGYHGWQDPYESPTTNAMRLYDEELGKNALEQDVAHTVTNIMVDVLDDLKDRRDIDNAFDMIDDDVMAELEQTICEKIEPHVLAIVEEEGCKQYDRGYQDGGDQ